MLKNFRLVMAWCLLAGASLSFAVVANEQVQPKKEKKQLPDTKEAVEQSNFMRKKLAATNTILEGLSVEDTDLVVSGAKALLELSASEKFQVKNDVMYRQFSNEFQRSANTERSRLIFLQHPWMRRTNITSVSCFIRHFRRSGTGS